MTWDTRLKRWAHTLLYQEFEDKVNHPCKPLGEEPTNPLPAQLTGEGLTGITEIPVRADTWKRINILWFIMKI